MAGYHQLGLLPNECISVPDTNAYCSYQSGNSYNGSSLDLSSSQPYAPIYNYGSTMDNSNNHPNNYAHLNNFNNLTNPVNHVAPGLFQHPPPTTFSAFNSNASIRPSFSSLDCNLSNVNGSYELNHSETLSSNTYSTNYYSANQDQVYQSQSSSNPVDCSTFRRNINELSKKKDAGTTSPRKTYRSTRYSPKYIRSNGKSVDKKYSRSSSSFGRNSMDGSYKISNLSDCGKGDNGSSRTRRGLEEKCRDESAAKKKRSPSRRMHRSYRRKSNSPIKHVTRKKMSSSYQEKVEIPQVDATEMGKKTSADEDKGRCSDEKDDINEVKAAWSRSSPAHLYYQRAEKSISSLKATKKLVQLCDKFNSNLVHKSERMSNLQDAKKTLDTSPKGIRSSGECITAVDCNAVSSNETESEVNCESENIVLETPTSGEVSSDIRVESKCSNRKLSKSTKKQQGSKAENASANSDAEDDVGSSSSSSGSDVEDWVDRGFEEMERKKEHPHRLHPELWFNDEGEMNDGPVCRCSMKARRSGIRHGYYVGEEPLNQCDPWSNNANILFHYFITVSPPTNFLVKSPTIITHDDHEFIFEGFSLFSHYPLEEAPTCQVIRFNIEYAIIIVQDDFPENFCIRELDLFYEYLFIDVLELVDLNLKAMGDEDGCPRFHFMPRFVRKLPDNGKEILSMNEVLLYLLRSATPVVSEEELPRIGNFSEEDWLSYTDQLKGMIATFAGKKPSSIRIDQLDREPLNDGDELGNGSGHFPVIVHFGIRPPQLSYAGNPEYQKALREFVKFRHLLANMPKPSAEDKRQLEAKENHLKEMRMAISMKREVAVDLSSEGFYRTGIMCDIVQHTLLIPVLVRHLRFHRSLKKLEENINYKFTNRLLLQLALTHPSYRENFGTNPDHARNSLTNCGVRQPQYGDKKIQYMNTHKRGINTLVNIMSRFGRHTESDSKITHNERLEFLGDAVVEFLSSIHLFHLFPGLEEGGLATYRAAVVQNQHLSILAEKLDLEKFVLHAHGSDLCHTLELRHAMANCFEALMGAIFIDSGIEKADAVFSTTLFKGEPILLDVWMNYKPHPLQEQEPDGDRKWIKTFPVLQKIAQFEESIGLYFNHIRLLARAFTDRTIGYNYLTLGSNQRLEFLGDTVLQLIASEYLYKFFPEHHEGHLSLLRSSLVNNRTQAVVCDDLNMTEYAIYSNLKTELKTKDRADLLEAFLGALYIDQGLEFCRMFCNVCFFPRLQQFIIKQEWNDPKSKLQQCCLTLRSVEGGEPDIPIYKVIECKGPTNTRVYTVAVYFRNTRLAKASGHSIQRAEMLAAQRALVSNTELFPQLAYQKMVIEKNMQNQGVDSKNEKRKRPHSSSEERRERRHRRPVERTGRATPEAGEIRMRPGRATPEAGEIRMRPGRPTPEAGEIRMRPGRATPEAGEIRMRPGRATPEAGEIRMRPGRATPEAGEIRMRPGRATPEAGEIRMRPGRATPDASEIRMRPGRATPDASEIRMKRRSMNRRGNELKASVTKRNPKRLGRESESRRRRSPERVSSKSGFAKPGSYFAGEREPPNSPYLYMDHETRGRAPCQRGGDRVGVFSDSQTIKWMDDVNRFIGKLQSAEK